MNIVLKISWKTALVAALAITACGASFADTVTVLPSVITSTSGYSDDLLATVTYSGGSYHYEYTLSYLQSYNSSPLTWFSVGNLKNYAFTNAGNDKGFINPVYGVTSNNSVLWTGSAAVGQTVKFWYDSIYDPNVVLISLKGNRLASGNTLGMVPEPGTLASIAMGLAGICGMALKRRSSKA